MDERIYRNLLSYVNGGGILFICGCHFDTRTNFKSRPQFLRNGKICDLAGGDIVGPGSKVFDKFRVCKLRNVIAQQTKEFLFEHTVGKGKVYFFNFYDYPSDSRLVKDIQNILTSIGEQVRKGSSIYIEGTNSRFINYTLWKNGRHARMYLSNIDWQHKRGKSIIIKNGERSIRVVVPGHNRLTINL
jgi:hypothetical protein